jgi:2-polyprenyl-3-methyl-5-hydroxy-6-metoxy-1,4-benzoquinol methylase
MTEIYQNLPEFIGQAFADASLPVIDTEEIRRCPTCDHASFVSHAKGYDYELRTCANCWRFVCCEVCGHVWLNPRPALHTLPTIYPAHYYAYNYDQQIPWLSQRAKALLDRRKLRHILRTLPSPPRSCLDVGCGNGRYLRELARSGVPRQGLIGIDLDERLVDRLRNDGFRAYCQRIEDCDQIEPHSLSLITMFHVIEHLNDPRRATGRLAHWLAPGGVLAIETPNYESLDARLFRKTYWGGYHIPRHWNLFKPSTLSKLLHESGLTPIGLHFQTGHSFWAYSLHHALRYGRTPWPTVAGWFDPLGSLPAVAAFTAFDKLRAGLGARTSAMLMLARRDGT